MKFEEKNLPAQKITRWLSNAAAIRLTYIPGKGGATRIKFQMFPAGL